MSPSPFSENTNSSADPSGASRNGRGNAAHYSNAETDSILDTEMNNTALDQGERFDRARRSAIKVYAVLIAIGVVIGGLTLAGVVVLMQHFGLTDVPTQVNQQQ